MAVTIANPVTASFKIERRASEGSKLTGETSRLNLGLTRHIAEGGRSLKDSILIAI
jgi:hypothetical protein